MFVLSRNALIVCFHSDLGRIEPVASQSFVLIAGEPMLIQADPLARTISGCPVYGAGLKACLKTLSVDAGYSTLLFVGDRPICLDTVRGATDSSPPGLYSVKAPGQAFVQSDA